MALAENKNIKHYDNDNDSNQLDIKLESEAFINKIRGEEIDNDKNREYEKSNLIIRRYQIFLIMKTLP